MEIMRVRWEQLRLQKNFFVRFGGAVKVPKPFCFVCDWVRIISSRSLLISMHGSAVWYTNRVYQAHQVSMDRPDRRIDSPSETGTQAASWGKLGLKFAHSGSEVSECPFQCEVFSLVISCEVW